MWDAIVIGSGIGGMTAAGLLAGVAGKKVLILEKHSEPGGLTHTFRRQGASWDVGLHYVGELETGSQSRQLFDYLSGGHLQWNKMPEDFERFIYPGFEFAVPSDPKTYEQRLIDCFPEEQSAIHRYFGDIVAARRWVVLGFVRGRVPQAVAPLIGLIQRLTGGDAKQTTKRYLDKHFQSSALRALLATQWGDYGLPPARSAFAIHAQIVSHYLHGAWFPDGGSSRIARTFETGIERCGGVIRVCQEVTEILVEDGRATGVKVLDRRGPVPREVIHLAPVVISNVGAPITFKQLLPVDGETGSKTAELRALIERLKGGMSAVTLYLRITEPVSVLGVRGENFWINTNMDHDAVEAHARMVLEGKPAHAYVSFPSAKSGEERFHTAEIIAFVDYQAFVQWNDKPTGDRGIAYAALKNRISDGLLQVAETAIPGLTALVDYAELSTPLTVEHYTSHPGGQFYGLPATPERYRSQLLGPRTPIEGLYLSGEDAGCLGIVGAMQGGVSAASQAIGSKSFGMIRAALKRGPDNFAPVLLPPEKKRALVVGKTQLTSTIWRMDLELEGLIEDFAPGQFARVRVADWEWRDYSIAALEGNKASFLISTSTGGHGSQFVLGVECGNSTEVELPLGQYTLVRSSNRKVFIATGTGIAPFLPIFQKLDKESALDHYQLIFGCRTEAEDITAYFGILPADLIRCYSRSEAPPGGLKGRVTDALSALNLDYAATDFYVCGASAMVTDSSSKLKQFGAKNIYTESF